MKHFYILIASILLLTCDSDNEIDPSCSFLTTGLTINRQLNLNLPQFSDLQFTGNSVYLPGLGNQGVIVANVGNNFFAWDAADPNHQIQSCSVLVPNGSLATCGCDDENTYSLVNGRISGADLPCTLLFYNITLQGNTLFIQN